VLKGVYQAVLKGVVLGCVKGRRIGLC